MVVYYLGRLGRDGKVQSGLVTGETTGSLKSVASEARAVPRQDMIGIDIYSLLQYARRIQKTTAFPVISKIELFFQRYIS